jgi:hypothetical protein
MEIFGQLSNPAQRALANAKITTLKKLSTYSEDQILALHGIGPSSMPILRNLLASANLQFKDGSQR